MSMLFEKQNMCQKTTQLVYSVEKKRSIIDTMQFWHLLPAG